MKFIFRLLIRAIIHDFSKMSKANFGEYCQMTSEIIRLPYFSSEYRKIQKKYQDVMNRHYKTSRHHLQYFNGHIDQMNLIDLIEMYYDWCAAIKRHPNGDFLKSVKINAEYYNISNDIKRIFINQYQEDKND